MSALILSIVVPWLAVYVVASLVGLYVRGEARHDIRDMAEMNKTDNYLYDADEEERAAETYMKITKALRFMPVWPFVLVWLGVREIGRARARRVETLKQVQSILDRKKVTS